MNITSNSPEIADSKNGIVISDQLRNWSLVLLMLTYTTNVIDRNILSIVSQSIKLEFHVSDASLGLLQGLAFAVFYAGLGIPIARLTERYSRVNVLTICLVIWSSMSMLTSMAGSYLLLVLCRFGVGIGEAGCAPAAHALITDYYPPDRRASALSVYTFGVPFGSMIGAIVVGAVAQRWGWRPAFFVVGLPGILLAVVLKLVLREPIRGQSDLVSHPKNLEEPSLPPPSITEVARHMFRNRSMRHLAFGLMLMTMVGYGTTAFAALYFIRQFGLSLSQVGLLVGLTTGISTGLGTLLSGFLIDKAIKIDRRWYALFPAIASTIAWPFYLAAYSSQSLNNAIVFLILAGLFGSSGLAPTYAVMHNLVGPRMRATATAILLLCLNLIALSFGPFFTGLSSDIFTSHIFSQYNLGGFQEICNNGHLSNVFDIAKTCTTSSAIGTRWAIILTFMFGAWGSIHFFLGAKTLREDLSVSGLMGNA